MSTFLLSALTSALATALLIIGLAIAALVIYATWPIYLAGVATVAVPWGAWWVWRRRQS